ncbi:MAG: nucleotidyltransferase family protein [Prochlorothrix sp.]
MQSDVTALLAQRALVGNAAIVAFCQEHHIRRLALFGSILRDDFGPDSDVDFLVEFEPGYVPGYIHLAGMELALSDLIGRKADVRTAAELSPYFREEVLQEALVQYVKLDLC